MTEKAQIKFNGVTYQYNGYSVVYPNSYYLGLDGQVKFHDSTTPTAEGYIKLVPIPVPIPECSVKEEHSAITLQQDGVEYIYVACRPPTIGEWYVNFKGIVKQAIHQATRRSARVIVRPAPVEYKFGGAVFVYEGETRRIFHGEWYLGGGDPMYRGFLGEYTAEYPVLHPVLYPGAKTWVIST